MEQPKSESALTETPTNIGLRWYKSRWLLAVTALILGLFIVIGVEAAAISEANARATAAQNELTTTQSDLSAARSEAKAATDVLSAAQSEATTAKDALSAAQAGLAARKTTLDAAAAAVAAREVKVGAAEKAAQANTFAGDGTYLVGTDVQPGTYKADASPGCYWARLSSLSTSDIIDNQNSDGPVVLQILPTDKAVEVARCGEFHKVG
jgi:multidrug efflux pump subunit AcrA (membrane-fusion protein)